MVLPAYAIVATLPDSVFLLLIQFVVFSFSPESTRSMARTRFQEFLLLAAGLTPKTPTKTIDTFPNDAQNYII